MSRGGRGSGFHLARSNEDVRLKPIPEDLLGRRATAHCMRIAGGNRSARLATICSLGAVRFLRETDI
jgi:hypothetical protein